MLRKTSSRGFGIVVILLVLIAVAVLAYMNWDKVVSKKESLDELRNTPTQLKEELQEHIETFENKTKEIEEKLKKESQ